MKFLIHVIEPQPSKLNVHQGYEFISLKWRSLRCQPPGHFSSCDLTIQMGSQLRQNTECCHHYNRIDGSLVVVRISEITRLKRGL